jgi:NAD(P)-dependent dehydrogenase (short-subunit alcohol dehydrogenase family)
MRPASTRAIFDELTPEQFDRQFAASLIGPMNVTRAVLPVMRKQRSGHIISISSSAGLAAGYDFVPAYAASKFGLESWMFAGSRHAANTRSGGRPYVHSVTMVS